MRFASFSTLLLIAAGQALNSAHAFAGSKGQMQGNSSARVSTSHSMGVNSGSQQKFTKLPNGTLDKYHVAPRETLTQKIGNSLGKYPVKTPTIDPQGKLPIINTQPKPLDPGIGNGYKPPKDLGIGKGKLPIKPIDLGIGKGKEKLPLNPDLVDKLKGGIKPKIPICPPYPFPKDPSHPHCHCPSFFFDWCWYPGFDDCYGYVGGICLPTVVTQTVVVEMPVGAALPKGALPQIVPGTTISVALLNSGDKAGRVLMQYGSLALPAELMKWEADKVTFVVPSVALKEPVAVKLFFLKADGEMLHAVDAELVAATVQK